MSNLSNSLQNLCFTVTDDFRFDGQAMMSIGLRGIVYYDIDELDKY